MLIGKELEFSHVDEFGLSLICSFWEVLVNFCRQNAAEVGAGYHGPCTRLGAPTFTRFHALQQKSNTTPSSMPGRYEGPNQINRAAAIMPFVSLNKATLYPDVAGTVRNAANAVVAVHNMSLFSLSHALLFEQCHENTQSHGQEEGTPARPLQRRCADVLRTDALSWSRNKARCS